MKKFYLLLISVSVIFFATSSVSIREHSSQNGIVGYTGAPGSFGTCNSCHGGGSAAASGITITAVPAFTNNMYMPDSMYQLTVSGSATGFSHYGFACEILKAGNTSAGTIGSNVAGGVKLGQFNSQRIQAIHTTPKTGSVANFTFSWKAPSTGNATIYAIVNAVNGNSNTNGDFPISPVNMLLEPMPAPVDTTTQDTTSIVSLLQQQHIINDLKIYPNPATVFAELSFTAQKSGALFTTITDLGGREIRRNASNQATPGLNKLSINVHGLEAGVYFVALFSGEEKLGQKMLIVR